MISGQIPILGSLRATDYESPITPFPRSTWIHPHVPYDNFDRVCANIRRRAREAEDELRRSQSSERQRTRDSTNYKPKHRAEEADDLGVSTRCEEAKQQASAALARPWPYLSGYRHPRVARPAREPNPVMEEEMKRSEEAKWKPNLCQEEAAGGKQRTVENDLKMISVSKTSSGDQQTNQASPPQDQDHSSLCESEDAISISSSHDSSDDSVTLPGVRSCATDDDSASENDCEGGEDETQHSSDESRPDSEQDSPCSGTRDDFPTPPSIKAGPLPRPTEPPASGKMHSRWEIPLSFLPHDFPTASLAHTVTAHAQARVQGEGKSPRANSKNDAPTKTPTQQEAYDLEADFPALHPPKKALLLGVWRDGNPKTRRGAEGRGGHVQPQIQRQESGASCQRMERAAPRGESSVCAGDHKSVLDIQTFGQRVAPTIRCEEPKAKNQPPARDAGTDGVDVNARTWASAAKAGMRRAADARDRARHGEIQQIVSTSRALAGNSAAHNFPNKGIHSYQASRPMHCGSCNTKPFVRAVHHPANQAHRVDGPPGVRCLRFPS